RVHIPSPSNIARSSCLLTLYFFFSSRRRHTRFDCDWSSDVCSSDLAELLARERGGDFAVQRDAFPREELGVHRLAREGVPKGERSEERRVGKECRTGRT